MDANERRPACCGCCCWIPAFAGMTVGSAGMTVGSAGMTAGSAGMTAGECGNDGGVMDDISEV